MRSTGDPDLLGHHSVLIYPFRHQLVGGARVSRLASLEPRWAHWASRFTESDLAAKLESTGFFFPYVRDLLYPEIGWLRQHCPAEDCEEWAEVLRSWSAEGLSAVCGELTAGVLRLTLRQEVHSALEEFVVRCPGNPHVEPADLPARCDWIDAQLYPSGIGFILFRVRLTSERPKLSQLIRLNQSLRQVLPASRRMRLAELETAGGDRLNLRDLMNFLTQGLAAPWAIPQAQRGVFPAPPGLGPRCQVYTDGEAGRTYGERCHLLSFAACDLTASAPLGLPEGPFPSPTDRLVFELAACIGLGESVNNPTWVPSQEQAAKYCRDNRINLWRIWTGMVLKDSLVFLGTEDVPFNRRSLPRLVENEYLPLYLFALYQKTQLFTFSNELLREVALSSGQLTGARNLLQRFVSFRSQYWFAEITRKPQGGEMYRTFQRGLEVPAAYEMVTGSVKDVKDYYEGVWMRRMQWLKDAVTFGGPVLVALGAVRMALDTTRYGWAFGVACVLVVFVLAMLALRWRRGAALRRAWSRKSKTPRPKILPGPWRAGSDSTRAAA
jgi:hypothetical protein